MPEKPKKFKHESSFVSVAYAIEKVWAGESRRVDLNYNILGRPVTVRIYQTVPGILRVDIREPKVKISKKKA